MNIFRRIKERQAAALNEAGEKPLVSDEDFEMNPPIDKNNPVPNENPEDNEDPPAGDKDDPANTDTDDMPTEDEFVPAVDEDDPPTGEEDTPKGDEDQDPPAEDDPNEEPSSNEPEDGKQTRILNLSPIDRGINNIKLYDQFMSLKGTAGIIHKKLETWVTLESDKKTIDVYTKLLEDLRELRDILDEYITLKYMTKSWEDNAVNYALFVSKLNEITKVMLGDEFNEVREENDDK